MIAKSSISPSGLVKMTNFFWAALGPAHLRGSFLSSSSSSEESEERAVLPAAHKER